MLTYKEYTIKWSHYNPPKDRWRGQTQRYTECLLLDEDKKVVHKVKALCHMDDNFDRSIGRKISLTRLLNQDTFDKEFRKGVWEEYRNMVEGGRW